LRDLPATLDQAVAEQLPGLAYGSFDQARPGSVKKYGLTHKVVPAPLDEATQEAIMPCVPCLAVHFNQTV